MKSLVGPIWRSGKSIYMTSGQGEKKKRFRPRFFNALTFGHFTYMLQTTLHSAATALVFHSIKQLRCLSSNWRTPSR